MSSLSAEKLWAKNDLHGHLTVLTTPFHDDLSIDYDGLRENVQRARALPCVTGFYVNSIFNEATALTLAERKRLTEVVIASLPKGVPTVVAIGGVPLQDAIELAQHAQSAGAAMLTLWPPIFGYRSKAGVLAYFRAVIESVSMPVSVYRSGLDEFGYLASLDEVRALIDYPHVCAIKEASLSLTKYLEIVDAIGDRVAVSCPLDEYWVAGRMLMPSRAPDWFLGTSRPLICESTARPYLSELRTAANRGDSAAVEPALARVVRITNALHTTFLEGGAHNVALTKKVTELLGYRGGKVRPPLSPPDEGFLVGVRAILQDAGLMPARVERESLAAD